MNLFFQLEYFVKWCKLSDDRNTWENGEHVDRRLIQQYEDVCRNTERKQDVKPTKILGLTLVPSRACNAGQLMCLVEWQNAERQWITAEAVQKKFPQSLVEFYEKHIEWQ